MCEKSLPHDLSWNEAGLVPAIVQNRSTGEVLMMAWMNREALDLTLATGVVHFWSRSRRKLWKKGETSGNTLALDAITVDCDLDTLIIQACPAGPACHTGARTCFTDPDVDVLTPPQGFADLEPLWQTVTHRMAGGESTSYTARLARGGAPKTARKLIEEAAELATAALQHETGVAGPSRVAEEAADLVYHLLVLLAERGLPASRVLAELASRREKGGWPSTATALMSCSVHEPLRHVDEEAGLD